MGLSGEEVTIRDSPHRIGVCRHVCPPKSLRGFLMDNYFSDFVKKSEKF